MTTRAHAGKTGRGVLAGILVGLVGLVGLAGPVGAATAADPPGPEEASDRGAPLAAWEMIGDRLIPTEDLDALAVVAPGDTLRPGDAGRTAGIVRDRLREMGWWSASVTAREEIGDDGTVRGILAVSAGQAVELGEIAVVGNRELSREEIRAQMDLRPGRAFDADVFRVDAARILRTYSERGYALARVYPGRFRITPDGRLGIDVRISEGPVSEIESVRVFGNEQTQVGVVARIGGVRVGDRWDVRRVEDMARRLRREGLFTRVAEPRIVTGTRDNRIGIEIDLEEGPSGSLFGVLGYNPDRAGGGEVVGIVDLRLMNILGTARRASLRFERQGQDLQDLAFRFREPWVLGSPVSVEGGASQALRDTLFSRTDLDLTLSVPIGDASFVFVAVERRDSSFDDALGTPVRETAKGGSVGLETDQRDQRWNPGRGWAARGRLGVRRTEDGVRRTRLEFGGQALASLGRNWILSEEAGARGVWSTAVDVPLYEQFYLGGTNTLRGYREEQFHGERVWWARSEMRYRLTVRSRAYVFADAGGWEFDTPIADGPPVTVRDTLVGAGVGAALATRRSGRIRIELAVGRGDGYSDAKVHAALEQVF